MKRAFRLTLVFTLLALLLASIGIAGAGAARSPFVGRWVSTDIDGSSQTLMIGGGPGDSHRATLFDDRATVACAAYDDSPATAQGSGTEAGNVLSGTWDVYCLARPRVKVLDDFGFEFTYEPINETLTDGFGVVWTRR